MPKTSYPYLMRTLLCLIAVALAWPTFTIWSSWLQWSPENLAVLRHMRATVLPDYTVTSLVLCIGVGLGVALLGVSSAILVSLLEFPGRRWLEWGLLLPLAIPAYVVAYAYTDFLQFSGPLQSSLRSFFGWQGAWWPDIRSVWGAIIILSLTLYPYVYLLVRTALSERAVHLLEAARLLGASLPRRIRTIALPLARPALAAGVALALMETLADYGVASYFGIQTFTVGIYKAWLALNNPIAAGQLATLLLLWVLLLLRWESHAQSKMRFYTDHNAHHTQDSQPYVLGKKAAWFALFLGALPIVLGFFLPMGILFWSWVTDPLPQQWGRFFQWGWNSLYLSFLGAGCAVVLALALVSANRLYRSQLTRMLSQVVGLGYAIPGAVVVIGILIPLSWLQQADFGGQIVYWITGTSIGLIWAYLVRFCAIAMQSVHSGYARIPFDLDESSRTLGVSGWPLFKRLHMPLLRRSTLAALLLVFVDIMKELPVTLVLRPFNTDTLAVVAYQFARDERLGEAALPSLSLALVGLIPVILLSYTLRPQQQKSNVSETSSP